MTRVLKSNTTVPDSLYVKRRADTLLAEIIAEMGRPGYVLVARQMGKTNMLLYAKRTLPKPDDAFIYIDLTNAFTDARECFRHIINTAIESYPDKFGYLTTEIEAERAVTTRLDHAEHSHELRKLLRVVKGKIVIILDEVDALTNVNYSDTIFKQIRSVYFTRANFPELERLTYIISGVAEPTTLIKDPTISPFNIGKNIFLTDFSPNEYQEFLRVSALNLMPDVEDRIYYWAAGNPRITYDVCSELESLLLTGEIPSIDTVDELIRNMYFSSLDRAPIDHIRELVYNDKELRRAIIALKSQQGDNLTKSLRKKLYLAGILGSDFDSASPKIKNRVIEEAFSLTILEEIDSKPQFDFDTLKLLYVAENYIEIVLIPQTDIKRMLESSDSVFAENIIIISYLKTHFYNLIIQHFENFGFGFDSLGNEHDSFMSVKLENLYLCGTSYLYLNEPAKAVPYFQSVIDKGLKDQFYYYSRNNLGAAMLQLENYQPEEIIRNLTAAVEELKMDQPALKAASIQSLRNMSYFQISQAQLSIPDLSAARASLQVSLRSADVPSKPSILYAVAKITESTDTVETLLEEAAQIIIENQVKARNYNIDNILGVSYELLLEITQLWMTLGNHAVLTELIQYVINSDLSDEPKPTYLNSSNLSRNEFDLTQLNAQLSLYHLILTNFTTLIKPRHAHAILVFVTENPTDKVQLAASLPLVMNLANSGLLGQISAQEASKITAHLVYVHSRRQNNDTLQLTSFLKRSYLNSEDVSSNDAVLINYYEFDVLKQSNPINAFNIARNILITLGSSIADERRPTLVRLDSIDNIKHNTIRGFTQLRPFLGNKAANVKRNDHVTVLYKDATLKSGKYRIFEYDVTKGNCIIL